MCKARRLFNAELLSLMGNHMLITGYDTLQIICEANTSTVPPRHLHLGFVYIYMGYFTFIPALLQCP